MNTTNGGFFRHVFGTIARGYLLGIGFSIALGAAYYISWKVFISRMNTDVMSMSSPTIGTDNTVKDITISGVSEQTHDGVTLIVGNATNNGKVPARGIQIRANLFNHGKFVDQYSTNLTGSLAPGASQYFKISCGCKDNPPAEHDSFKVEAINEY